jgi:hypothetical protein
MEYNIKHNRYLQLHLRNDNDIDISTRIHRLVAITFLYNDGPINKTQVNHIDGNIYNNHANNLEWISPYENTMHAIKHDLIKRKTRKVIQKDLDGNVIAEFNSIREAVKKTNIQSIRDALCYNFILKGFIWEYGDILPNLSYITHNDEIWIKIKNHEQYSISNYGRIKHNDKNILVKGMIYRGYNIVYMCNLHNKTNNRYYVHRLVAEAFIKKNANCTEVDHIDTDPLNNHVNNLRWCTHSENMNNEITKEKLSRKIRQYDKNNNFIKEYKSLIDASNETKISLTNIGHCLKNYHNQKTAGGYIWKYKSK